MENIDFSNEKVLNILERYDAKKKSILECMKDIDLSGITNDQLGEEKMKFDRCMTGLGFGRKDFSFTHL